jgi:hypothetical protein
LDARNGITHPFSDIDDLERVFREIASERHDRARAVAEWTFADNARKHMRIWEFLLARKAGRTPPHAIANDLSAMGVVT